MCRSRAALIAYVHCSFFYIYLPLNFFLYTQWRGERGNAIHKNSIAHQYRVY
jgi:hypothetical protein